MLDLKKDRKDYKQLLKIDGEYEIDKMLITSYSLDMDTLIQILCVLQEVSAQENEIFNLQALRSMSKKVVVVCQNGRINVPKTEKKLYTMLENMVYTINLKNNGNFSEGEHPSFHPKVWIIRYVNKTNNKDIKYKLIVSSKNLTFTRNWDAQINLQGEYLKDNSKSNLPIQSFIKHIQENVDIKNNKEDQYFYEFINTLQKEIPYVKFDYKNEELDVQDCEFIMFEKNSKSKIEFLQDNCSKKIKSALIVSPFIEEKPLKTLCKNLDEEGKISLITTENELNKIYNSNEKLKKVEIYILKEAIVEGEYKSFESYNSDMDDKQIEDEDSKNAMNQDVHAKMFIIQCEDCTYFYIGSANLTNSAFNRNTEVMLKIIIKNNNFLENILKDLKIIKSKEEDMYFKRVYLEDIKEEIVEETDKEKLNKIERQFFELKPYATCKNEKDEEYKVTIKFQDLEKIDLKNCKITIIPLNEKVKEQEIKETVTFNNLKIEDISEFYIVKFYLNSEKNSEQKIIKINTENIPKLDSRISKIFSDIIKNQDNFLEYLALILNDDYFYMLVGKVLEDGNINKSKYSIEYMPALYERMLKMMVNNPKRLEDIEDFNNLIEDKKKIPDGFLELYNTFKKVGEKLENK